eukprot:jgi/Botrbrau1/18834/Bobra.0868s0001.2
MSRSLATKRKISSRAPRGLLRNQIFRQATVSSSHFTEIHLSTELRNAFFNDEEGSSIVRMAIIDEHKKRWKATVYRLPKGARFKIRECMVHNKVRIGDTVELSVDGKGRLRFACKKAEDVQGGLASDTASPQQEGCLTHSGNRSSQEVWTPVGRSLDHPERANVPREARREMSSPAVMHRSISSRAPPGLMRDEIFFRVTVCASHINKFWLRKEIMDAFFGDGKSPSNIKKVFIDDHNKCWKATIYRVKAGNGSVLQIRECMVGHNVQIGDIVELSVDVEGRLRFACKRAEGGLASDTASPQEEDCLTHSGKRSSQEVWTPVGRSLDHPGRAKVSREARREMSSPARRHRPLSSWAPPGLIRNKIFCQVTVCASHFQQMFLRTEVTNAFFGGEKSPSIITKAIIDHHDKRWKATIRLYKKGSHFKVRECMLGNNVQIGDTVELSVDVKGQLRFACKRAEDTEKEQDVTLSEPPRSLPKSCSKRLISRSPANTEDAQRHPIIVEDEEPAEDSGQPIGGSTPLGSASSEQQTPEQAEEAAEDNIDVAATAESGPAPTPRVEEVARCQSLERGRGPLTEPGGTQRILVGPSQGMLPNTVLLNEEITFIGCVRYHQIPRREGGQAAEILNAMLDDGGRVWDLETRWISSTTGRDSVVCSPQPEICLLPNGYCKDHGLLAGDTLLRFTDSEGKLRISHKKARSGGLSLCMEHEPQGGRQGMTRLVKAPEGIPPNTVLLKDKFVESQFDNPPGGYFKLNDPGDPDSTPTSVLDNQLRVWDLGVRQTCVRVSRDSHMSKPDLDFFLPRDFFKANDVREGDTVGLRTDADRFLRIFHDRADMPHTSSRSDEMGVLPPAPSSLGRVSAPSCVGR